MQPTPQAANPFTNPDAPGGGEKAPRPRDMVGALVAYSPRIFTPAGAPGNATGVGGGDARDRVTADLVILEMPGPIYFGGSPEYESDPKPHTHMLQPGAPARFTGVWVSNSNIVKALAPGGTPQVGAMILGRIERSEIGNRPFNLVAVDGTPDMAKAIQIHSAIAMGQLRYQDPIPLGGAAAPANSVQYAPQPAPAAPAPVAPAVDPAYAAWQASQQQPAAAPVDPAYAAWQAQQAQAAAAAQLAAQQVVQNAFPQAQAMPPGYPVPQVIPGYAPAPAAPVGPPPPAGWTQTGWDTLTAEQKAEVLRSLPPQQMAPPL